jgi:hypothetical protein
MSDDKTPMERFEDLARKVFSKDPKRVPKPEEDAEEIMEGGVPPTGEEEPGE